MKTIGAMIVACLFTIVSRADTREAPHPTPIELIESVAANLLSVR